MEEVPLHSRSFWLFLSKQILELPGSMCTWSTFSPAWWHAQPSPYLLDRLADWCVCVT